MDTWLIPAVFGALVASAVGIAASLVLKRDLNASFARRRLATIAIAFCATAAYAIYPYYTLWRISSALQDRNAESLSSFIDWPVLRENLRTDIKARAAAPFFSAPENQSGLGLGAAAIGLAIVDNVIDAVVSPEMLRAWASKHEKGLSNVPRISAGRALDKISSVDSTLLSHVTYAFFEGATQFRVDVTNLEKQTTVSAYLSLSGGSWKLTRLVLPSVDEVTGTKSSDVNNDTSATAHLNRGIMLKGKSEYDLAISEINKAIELDPTNSRAYTARADIYRLKRDYARALVDINESVRLDPQSWSALSIRGGIHSLRGEHDSAVADPTAAINLNPNDSMAYNNRGFVYNNMDDYDRAMADLNEAIRLDPKNAFAYKNRAITYEKRNELQSALNDYQLATRLNPKLDEAVNGSARLRRILDSSSNAGTVTLPRQTLESSVMPMRVLGGDLYVDLAQYVGRPVILTDGQIFSATNSGALIRAGGVTFKISTDGIDRESFRFFLINCSGLAGDQCKLRVLVTPTGDKSAGFPVLRNVQIAH